MHTNQIIMRLNLLLQLVVYIFIKAFTTTTIAKKVIISQVIQIQLLVELNMKPTVILLLSYKKVSINIIKDKAQHKNFRQLLVWRPSQMIEMKNRCQKEVV